MKIGHGSQTLVGGLTFLALSCSSPKERGDDGLALPPEGTPLGGHWSAASGDPGPLPDRVYLKTNTESFNRLYYVAARDGDIWIAPNAETTGTDGQWQTMTLPAEMEGRVLELSLDDNEMIAVTSDRQIWSMTGALFDPSGFSWKMQWGFPFWTGAGQKLPEGILRWEWSVVSPQEDKNWTDPAGNLQPVGAGKCSHIWILPPDQSRLTFVDPWLPLDFSYGMCGLNRGRFRAENLSVSGSTVFVINRYGDLLTRLYDFDISGHDQAFFTYSYEDQTGAAAPAVQLPAAEWVKQPKIAGKITNLISVFKVGEDTLHRTLRVEAEGPTGATGYYEKDVLDPNPSAWIFHETGEPLRGAFVENRPDDNTDQNLGPSTDVGFSRNMERVDTLSVAGPITSIDDWAAEVPDFNVLCSPATLRVHLSKDLTPDLLLHAVDAIRVSPRATGLDPAPRPYNSTIEVPAPLVQSLDSQPPKVQDFVRQYLGSKRFQSVGLTVTSDEITICPATVALDGSCSAPVWKLLRDPG